MLRCVVACVALLMFGFPAEAKEPAVDLHDTLCPSGVVVAKERLLVHLLRSNPGIMEGLLLYPPPSRRETGLALVRALVADGDACVRPGTCDEKAAAALRDFRYAFGNFVRDGNRNGTYASRNPRLPASVYFASAPDGNNAIRCTRKADLIEPPDNSKDVSKLRIRGASDDLAADRNNKDAFKAASSAKISYHDDRSDGKKLSTKVKAVVGYAFEADTDTMLRQIIPYLSVNQTITDANGMRRLDDGNYVAGGVMFDWIKTDSETLSHRISTTPQFLYNTKDRSQIASGRIIYQPYLSLTDAQGQHVFNVNTATRMLAPNSMLQLLFDLRSDNGYYVRKGDIEDPAQHTSFFRVGSQFGFAWTFFDYSLTLRATQTLMYGYIGDKRKLDFFDASLSYSFDPHDYVSLTLGYTKGRDLYTTEPTQSWTVGLTAKY
ncbi:MAG: hypothetical protein Q8M24_20820 [Pseudolabrys sp.]|nr:hypothetical protein [Pseudolabrys sp.]MDP2297894.1 hypothetical protein [Pseudolabrys sp.]